MDVLPRDVAARCMNASTSASTLDSLEVSTATNSAPSPAATPYTNMKKAGGDVFAGAAPSSASPLFRTPTPTSTKKTNAQRNGFSPGPPTASVATTTRMERRHAKSNHSKGLVRCYDPVFMLDSTLRMVATSVSVYDGLVEVQRVGAIRARRPGGKQLRCTVFSDTGGLMIHTISDGKVPGQGNGAVYAILYFDPQEHEAAVHDVVTALRVPPCAVVPNQHELLGVATDLSPSFPHSAKSRSMSLSRKMCVESVPDVAALLDVLPPVPTPSGPMDSPCWHLALSEEWTPVLFWVLHRPSSGGVPSPVSATNAAQLVTLRLLRCLEPTAVHSHLHRLCGEWRVETTRLLMEAFLGLAGFDVEMCVPTCTVPLSMCPPSVMPCAEWRRSKDDPTAPVGASADDEMCGDQHSLQLLCHAAHVLCASTSVAPSITWGSFDDLTLRLLEAVVATVNTGPAWLLASPHLASCHGRLSRKAQATANGSASPTFMHPRLVSLFSVAVDLAWREGAVPINLRHLTLGYMRDPGGLAPTCARRPSFPAEATRHVQGLLSGVLGITHPVVSDLEAMLRGDPIECVGLTLVGHRDVVPVAAHLDCESQWWDTLSEYVQECDAPTVITTDPVGLGAGSSTTCDSAMAPKRVLACAQWTCDVSLTVDDVRRRALSGECGSLLSYAFRAEPFITGASTGSIAADRIERDGDGVTSSSFLIRVLGDVWELGAVLDSASRTDIGAVTSPYDTLDAAPSPTFNENKTGPLCCVGAARALPSNPTVHAYSSSGGGVGGVGLVSSVYETM